MALRIRLGLLGANGTMDPMAPQLIRVINSLTLLMSINYYILTNAKSSDFFGTNLFPSGSPGENVPREMSANIPFH